MITTNIFKIVLLSTRNNLTGRNSITSQAVWWENWSIWKGTRKPWMKIHLLRWFFGGMENIIHVKELCPVSECFISENDIIFRRWSFLVIWQRCNVTLFCSWFFFVVANIHNLNWVTYYDFYCRWENELLFQKEICKVRFKDLWNRRMLCCWLSDGIRDGWFTCNGWAIINCFSRIFSGIKRFLFWMSPYCFLDSHFYSINKISKKLFVFFLNHCQNFWETMFNYSHLIISKTCYHKPLKYFKIYLNLTEYFIFKDHTTKVK